MFIGHLLLILREVRRVLRRDGTLWLNLGFSYAAANGAGVYRSKDLVAIPWLLAIAAQYDGWYLRSPIVWSKGNAMPSSVTDRPSQDWEQVLLLSPSERYFYDREPLREPLQGQYAQRRLTPRSEHPKFAGQPVHRRPNYEMREEPAPEGNPDGRNKRATWDGLTETARLVEDLVAAGYDFLTALRQAMGAPTNDTVSESEALWRINTQPYKGAHYATYPIALPARAIQAGTPPAVCARCGKPWRRVMERAIATNEADDPTMETGRAGFGRARGGEADRRTVTVAQAEIAAYLRTSANGRAGECRARYGGKWEHWTRTDDSGARLPRPEDWVDLKDFLGLDDRFDADLLPYGGKQLEIMRLNNEFNLSRRGRTSTEIRDEFTNRLPANHLGWRPDCRCFDHAFVAPDDADPNDPHPVCAACGEDHTQPATVLDVTVGSGTTLQAAHLLGRKGIGFDLAGDYLAGHAKARVITPADLYAPPAIPAVNWQMALPENEVILGDCANVLPRLPRASVDLLFLDPPFNLGKKYGKGVDDRRNEAEYAELLRFWLAVAAPLLKSTGHLVLYHTPQWSFRAAAWLEEMGLHFRGWVARQVETANGVVNKPGSLRPEHYAFVWFSRSAEFTFNKIHLPHRRCSRCGDYATDWGGKEKHRNEDGKYASDVWADLPIPRGKAKSRAANELPLEAMLRWALALTEPGGYVFDPFLDSGTTAAACELAGRKWGGVELVEDNLPIIRHKSLTARGAAAHWTDDLAAQTRADLAMALMRLGHEPGLSDAALLEAGALAAQSRLENTGVPFGVENFEIEDVAKDGQW